MKMLKKIQPMLFKSLKFFLFKMLLLTCFSATVSAQVISDYDRTEHKFNRALQIIRLFYVDTVNDAELVEHAIVGMLRELDPHSTYLSQEDQKRANEPLQGSFEGIGVQFQIINDTIMVISPTSGGPSEKVGILPGDRIVTIDGEESTGRRINNNYVVRKLRGDKGTQVTVGISRRSVKDILEFTITRDKIPINSLDAAFIIEEEIGYIKLNRFARTTMDEFYTAFDELRDLGMESLILDLRGNSGGFLDVSISLADDFLPREKLIVYTEGRSAPREDYSARRKGRFEKGKLVILIDEGSASASEIVSGAVQDWDRGIIIGRRSFGKGLVQRPFSLPDGSVMRLTTGKYYTPVGRHIQKPFEDGVESYHKDLINRYNRGELTSADSIHFPDSLKYYTNNNRVVYGGGGIMPDFFVPLDTTRASEYYTNLFRKGIFNTFTLEYIDKNRSALTEKYPEFEVYYNDFEISESVLEDFFVYAEEKNVEKDEEITEESIELIRLQLKALIARNLWDVGAYIHIYSAIDDGIEKALKVLKDGTFEELDIKF